jgi:hypothetical protein
MYLTRLKKSCRPGRVSGIAAGGFSAGGRADAPNLRSSRGNAAASVNRWIKFSSGVAAPAAGCRTTTQRTEHEQQISENLSRGKFYPTALRSDRAPWRRRPLRISHSGFPLR